MLKPAILYADELKELMQLTWFDEEYKYYHLDGWHEDYEVNQTTWGKHEFVSIDDNGHVIGYIGYKINRRTNMANSAELVCFTKNRRDRMIFANDLKRALRDIFDKYFFRKFSFSVVIGNPAERGYDKLVKKYGGKIIGIQKEETILLDGDYYDMKLYEISRYDYMKSRRTMSEK